MTELDGKGSESEQQLNDVLAAYFDAIEAGLPEDRETLFRRHPDLAAGLVLFFAGEERMAKLAAPLLSVVRAGQAATPLPRDTVPLDVPSPEPPALPWHSFGDYELLEEIGRGGMGVI